MTSADAAAGTGAVPGAATAPEGAADAVVTPGAAAAADEASERGAGPVVVVAVPTYRRPAQLATLLAALTDQVADLHPPARVVVVDNDPAGGAAVVVRAAAGLDASYVHEPRPGLAAVRNAALDAATGAGARLLAFVDDDEVPEPGWLAALVGCWERTAADAVAGPARKVLAEPVDPWVRASAFFAGSSGRRTGDVVVGAASNNLLLDLDRLRAHGLRFDERFGLTGGEDTLLTRSLSAAGGTIRWCAEAVVHDPVPPERATRAWVLARERRTGSTWSRVHLALAPGTTARLRARGRLVVLGVGLVARGTVLDASGRLRGAPAVRARGQREVARGSGVLRGARGGLVEEYGRS